MIKLAIDLGSSMTKIYRADTNNGIVLAEPSCVAIFGEEEVRAVGKDAKNLIGKTAELNSIFYPVCEGEVVNVRLASIMLKEFLARVGVKGSGIKHTQVLFSVPCGVRSDVLYGYKLLAEECGLRKVWYVEQPYLAAIGAGAGFATGPVFCMDIGGGVTNAAVVSADGLIAGISMNIGGNNIDSDIILRISENKNLLIGALTAERVKNEIATLEIIARGSVVAEGSSTENYQPTSVCVHADELTESVRTYIRKACEYAKAVIWNLPAEVAASVNRNGVYLSGGIMKIPQVAQYIASLLGMRYSVYEEPQFATVVGGGALLQDKVLLQRFSKKEE